MTPPGGHASYSLPFVLGVLLGVCPATARAQDAQAPPGVQSACRPGTKGVSLEARGPRAESLLSAVAERLGPQLRSGGHHLCLAPRQGLAVRTPTRIVLQDLDLPDLVAVRVMALTTTEQPVNLASLPADGRAHVVAAVALELWQLQRPELSGPPPAPPKASAPATPTKAPAPPAPTKAPALTEPARTLARPAPAEGVAPPAAPRAAVPSGAAPAPVLAPAPPVVGPPPVVASPPVFAPLPVVGPPPVVAPPPVEPPRPPERRAAPEASPPEEGPSPEASAGASYMTGRDEKVPAWLATAGVSVSHLSSGLTLWGPQARVVWTPGRWSAEARMAFGTDERAVSVLGRIRTRTLGAGLGLHRRLAGEEVPLSRRPGFALSAGGFVEGLGVHFQPEAAQGAEGTSAWLGAFVAGAGLDGSFGLSPRLCLGLRLETAWVPLAARAQDDENSDLVAFAGFVAGAHLYLGSRF
ncbi:MAG: hypothetical protein KA712_08380 [Myxococcales bacterium]|nr:hypothetical protein [Myxococcales bacterium]